MRWTVALGSSLLLLFMALVPLAAAAEGEGAWIMIDFGEGTVLWHGIGAPEGQSAWNATVAAANRWGLALNVTYFGNEPFVQDIGDARPVWPDWWHLLEWNVSEWEMASTGPAGIALADGTVIGWFLSRDDPTWDYESPWPGPRPEAVPNDAGRYPVSTFRYDGANGGLAPTEGPAVGTMRWTYDTGAFEISSSPAIARGFLYVSTWTGFVALRTEDGTVAWQNPDVAGSSSPAVYGGAVYVGGRDGRLHVLSAVQGEELWNLTLQPDSVFSGVTASPRIAYGRVYLGTFNETGGNGTFYAIDLFRHEVFWSRSISSVHFSTAAVVDREVYVGLMGRFHPDDLTYEAPYGLLSLDADTGEVRWFVASNGSVAASPAVRGDTVYVTTKAGELFAVDRTHGAVRWVRTIRPSISSPAVTDDRVVVGEGLFGASGGLRAFGTDGDPLWSLELSAPVSASPTVAGNAVFAATNEPSGRVLAARLSDGQETWSFTPEPAEYILSSPVVLDGSLYIASDNGRVYRLDPLAVDGRIDPLGALRFVFPGILVAGIAVAVFLTLRRSRRAR